MPIKKHEFYEAVCDKCLLSLTINNIKYHPSVEFLYKKLLDVGWHFEINYFGYYNEEIVNILCPDCYNNIDKEQENENWRLHNC